MRPVQVDRLPAKECVVAIHQPHYFPWLGLVEKIACSDVFIFLDSVQFEKNGWQNRTRYSTESGLKFLTLPVRQSGIVSGAKPIKDIDLADRRAPAKHWQTLRQRYRKEPGWPRIAARLEAILACEYEKLLPLAIATTHLTLDLFKIRPRFVKASDLAVPGKRCDRLVNLIKAVRGTVYLSGAGAKEYIEPELFHGAEIRLAYQEFRHPSYRQMEGVDFMPGAFALEWFLADPDSAVGQFHQHLEKNRRQPPRCLEQ